MDHEIQVTDPHVFYKVDLWVTLIHNPKSNVSPSNSLQAMKQNRWTIKFRSLTYIYFVWSIYQIILKILSKITTQWNIGHVDLYLLWGQSLGHTVSLSENMALIHQIILEIKDKVTGPWNIGHIDLHLFLRSNIRSFWTLIPKYDVHTSNSLQDVSKITGP